MADERPELNRRKKDLIKEILESDLHGRRIYLLGSAEFGPTNEPVNIKSSVGLRKKFGKHGTLINAFHAVKYTNRNNEVFLVKTTGEHAYAYLNVNTYAGDIIEDGFIIASSESNEVFNEIKIVIDVDGISFHYPRRLGIKDKKYAYSEYPTISLLSEAINKETRLKYNKLYTYYTVDPATPTLNAFYSCNPTIVWMYGGLCGLNYTKNMLYYCLERTYDMLESEDIDIIVPVDAFLDDIYPNDSEELEYAYNMKYYHSTKDYLTEDTFGRPRSFLTQCIRFCRKQLNFGIVTHGVLGFNPHTNISRDYLYEGDHLKDMYIACMEWNKAQSKNHFYEFMVSCVAGDIRYNFGTVTDNAYLAYAAFCSAVTITEGTTNLPLSNSISLYQEFTEPVLADFAANGIVAFRHSPLYEIPVVYDGVTACTTHENYRLFVNVRMIQMTLSYLNKLYQFYIGWNMIDLIKEEIFVKDTKYILRVIMDKGILSDFTFNIAPYYAKNEIKVYLTLLTNYMTKAAVVAASINAEFEEGDV